MQAADRIAFLQAQRWVEAGTGSPLVLLHGFCESHALFDGLVPALAPHCRVICPDMPGHGGRPWGRGWRSLDDAAYWLRDLLDALQIDRCILGGHSMGGYIASAFADLFPDRLDGIALLHSTSLADPPDRHEKRTKTIEFVEAHGKEAFLRLFVPSLFHSPEATWLETLQAMTANVKEEAVVALTRIMRDRPDRSHALRALQVPVMYVVGAHDALVSPERSRIEMQGVALALLHRIEHASHMAMYEAPDRVIAALLSLVDACRRSR